MRSADYMPRGAGRRVQTRTLLPPDVHDATLKAAEEEGLTVSAWIGRLVEEALRARRSGEAA